MTAEYFVWQISRALDPEAASCGAKLKSARRATPAILVAFVAIAAGTLVVPASARAQDSKLKSAREDQAKTKARVEDINRRAEKLSGLVGDEKSSVAKLNIELRDAAKSAQETEGRLTEIEEKLAALSKEKEQRRQQLAKQNKSITRLLAAMQRMGRNPPPVIITQRKDALKMVRSAMLLARAFPEFRDKAAALSKDLNELVAVMTAQREEKAREEREKQRYEDTRTRLAALIETKQRTILSRSAELRELKKTGKLLSDKAAGLNQLIDKLDKAVARKTNLGQYDRKVARAEKKAADVKAKADIKAKTEAKARPRLPVEQPAPSGGTKVAAITPSTIGPSAVELAPSASGLGANPGRLEPAIPFQRALARLPLPANGKQLIRFGDTTSQGGKSKGLVIKTRHGAQITSPCDGWVVYAGSFRSYGQLLIINAGGGYHVLLANLSRLDVQLGQFVLAAEPVGTMAGLARGAGKTSDPVLYVEFRKNGKPIDPSPWWAKSRRRVQG